MENTVTNRQLFIVLVVVQMTFNAVDISKIMTQSAGAGSWLAILFATVLLSVLAYFISRLNGMFEGRMIFDYSKLLIGKFGAYWVSFLIAIYFIIVIITYCIFQGNLLQTNFLPESPTWATTLIALPVLGFIAYKGITNAARLTEIYGVILFIFALATHVVMSFQGDINHILPIYDTAETGRYIAATKNAVFPLLGFEVMLVIPFTAKNGKKANISAVLSLLAVGLFYIFNTLSCVMIIGENEILHYNFPLITAIRQVELPQLKFFVRIDFIYLTVGFIGNVAGLSFLYLSAVELICRMLPKLRRSYAVILLGAAVFIADLILRDITTIYDTLRNMITYMGLIVTGAIPLLLIIIAKVKKHGQKASA